MKIPNGYTEEQVIAIVDKIGRNLASSFTFGYYDVDDIKQQAFIEAIVVLEKEKYEEGRPLENFLYTHIRNRLINLKRNKLHRNDPPCGDCHEGRPCQDDGNYCEVYDKWIKTNSSKANLMRPLDIQNISDEHEKRTHDDSHSEEEVEIKELKDVINKKLPVEYRAVYLQMQAGVPVSKAKRLEVENIVREILSGVLPNVDGEEE